MSSIIENTFVMQEWTEYVIAEFLPYNKSHHMVSKTFNIVMNNNKNYYASKIQHAWRKHRALSVYDFENATSEEEILGFGLNAIRRFYYVHYPYPDYFILAASNQTQPYTKYFILSYIQNKRSDFTRREFYDVLKMCDMTDIMTTGY